MVFCTSKTQAAKIMMVMMGVQKGVHNELLYCNTAISAFVLDFMIGLGYLNI